MQHNFIEPSQNFLCMGQIRIEIMSRVTQEVPVQVLWQEECRLEENIISQLLPINWHDDIFFKLQANIENKIKANKMSRLLLQLLRRNFLNELLT